LGFTEETDFAKTMEYRPLNLYAASKRSLDMFLLQDYLMGKAPPRWYGLRFFNVYGAHEAHKGRMASMVYQIIKTMAVGERPKLFQGTGQDARDFVYVEDCVNHMIHLFGHEKAPSGIYNSGSGFCYTFSRLCRVVRDAFPCPEIDEAPLMEWVPFPEELKARYQSFTRANMLKMYDKAGYSKTPTILDYGVATCVEKLREMGEIK
jgi:ADP-L-glycero-D-manno-heptose 6-epimerase